MPRFTKHRKTKQYTNEFKTKAVQLSLLDDIQVQEVANTLDIHPFMLSRWRKEYREGIIMPDKRKKVVSLKKDRLKPLACNVARHTCTAERNIDTIIQLHSLIWAQALKRVANTGSAIIKILYYLWLFLAVYLNHAGFVSYG